MPAPKERMGGIFALGIMIRAEDETGERGELKRPLEFFLSSEAITPSECAAF